MKNRIIVLLLLMFVYDCGQGNKQLTIDNGQLSNNVEIQKGIVVNKVNCKNDTAQSYAIYLPSSYNSANKYPIIYFFDPHAKGNLPLTKYKALAEKYGYILIGSNNSKNGLDWNVITLLIQNVFNSTFGSISIDKSRIYMCGFSGGSRIAGVMGALNPDIKGIICCSASFPLRPETQARSFEWIGIAGNEDFNMTEMKELNRNMNGTSITHKLIIYDGKHQWPPENIMEEAFKWLENPVNVEAEKETADETLKEFKEHQTMKMYASSIDKQDAGWWKKEMNKLNAEIKETKDKEIMQQDKRVLGYISLTVYGYTSNAKNMNNSEKEQKYLDIYKIVDPENAEPWYLYAEIYASNGKDEKAIKSLQEAVKLGFDDIERMKKDDAFRSLKDKKEYLDILDGVKKNMAKN